MYNVEKGPLKKGQLIYKYFNIERIRDKSNLPFPINQQHLLVTKNALVRSLVLLI